MEQILYPSEIKRNNHLYMLNRLRKQFVEKQSKKVWPWSTGLLEYDPFDGRDRCADNNGNDWD